jgi:DNA-binding NarL/FixJ family response regulator
METKGPVRLLIADKHGEVRQNLKNRLMFEENIEVIGEIERYSEICEEIRSKSPHVILIDPVFRHQNGVNVLQTIMENCPGVPVIVLTAIADTSMTLDYKKLGVFKTLDKGIETRMLIEMIYSAAEID